MTYHTIQLTDTSDNWTAIGQSIGP